MVSNNTPGPRDDDDLNSKITLPDEMERALADALVPLKMQDARIQLSQITNDARDALKLLDVFKPEDGVRRVAAGISGFLTTIPEELVVPCRREAVLQISGRLMDVDLALTAIVEDSPKAPTLNSLLDNSYRQNLIDLIFVDGIEREERVKIALQLQTLMRYANKYNEYERISIACIDAYHSILNQLDEIIRLDKNLEPGVYEAAAIAITGYEDVIPESEQVRASTLHCLEVSSVDKRELSAIRAAIPNWTLIELAKPAFVDNAAA